MGFKWKKIKQFQKNTGSEVKSAITKYQPKAIILDVRNNPGGLLLSAVETAEIFLPSGKIVEIKDKNGRAIEKYISRRESNKLPFHLFVLQNKQSASAAEILSGAIKDRQVGKVIGEKSYGKGTVQTVYPISKDLYIKLTTAKYFTASGISFDKTGVIPLPAAKNK